MVSGVARGRPRGAARRRPRGTQATVGAGAVGPRRQRPCVEGPRAHGFRTGLWTLPRVALVIEQRDRRAVSPGPCLAPLGRARLDAAASRQTREGAERAGHPALGDDPLARGKKNARRRRAWIVFQDESGVSQRPPVRRTWAPARGDPRPTRICTVPALRAGGDEVREGIGSRCGSPPDVTRNHGREGADARRDRSTHPAPAGLWGLCLGRRRNRQYADAVDPADRGARRPIAVGAAGSPDTRSTAGRSGGSGTCPGAPGRYGCA